MKTINLKKKKISLMRKNQISNNNPKRNKRNGDSQMSHLSINGVAWQSTLTEEMIAHLSEQEISLLINSLNESVEEICNIYEVKG